MPNVLKHCLCWIADPIQVVPALWQKVPSNKSSNHHPLNSYKINYSWSAFHNLVWTKIQLHENQRCPSGMWSENTDSCILRPRMQGWKQQAKPCEPWTIRALGAIGHLCGTKLGAGWLFRKRTEHIKLLFVPVLWRMSLGVIRSIFLSRDLVVLCCFASALNKLKSQSQFFIRC